MGAFLMATTAHQRELWERVSRMVTECLAGNQDFGNVGFEPDDDRLSDKAKADLALELVGAAVSTIVGVCHMAVQPDLDPETPQEAWQAYARAVAAAMEV